MRKLTVEEQKKLISDQAVKQVFLSRPEIKNLTVEEQERRWLKKKIGVDKFRELLSTIDCINPDEI